MFAGHVVARLNVAACICDVRLRLAALSALPCPRVGGVVPSAGFSQHQTVSDKGCMLPFRRASQSCTSPSAAVSPPQLAHRRRAPTSFAVVVSCADWDGRHAMSRLASRCVGEWRAYALINIDDRIKHAGQTARAPWLLLRHALSGNYSIWRLCDGRELAQTRSGSPSTPPQQNNLQPRMSSTIIFPKPVPI